MFEYLGIRYLWRKIRPLKEKEDEQPPSVFFIWVIGIYFAMYGIASQRYENRRDTLENKVNIVIAQLDTPYAKKIMTRIPLLQKKHCPAKPEVVNPLSIIHSLFGKEESNYEITDKDKHLTVHFYHVTLRGNANEPIFITDTNRVLFIVKKESALIARVKT